MTGPGLRLSLADRLKTQPKEGTQLKKNKETTTNHHVPHQIKGVRGEPPGESATHYIRSCPAKERKKMNMKIPLLVGHSGKWIMQLKQESYKTTHTHTNKQRK